MLRAREVYFVFRGISESHMDAIEAVLERHKLALVTQHADGESRLVGIVGVDERRAWEIISQLGSVQRGRRGCDRVVARRRGADARHAVEAAPCDPVRQRIRRCRQRHGSR